MIEVEKLNIAIEQIEDALAAYFGGRYHSATVLAGASEQLLAGYVLKHGGTPSWHSSRSSITKIANALGSVDGARDEPTNEKAIGDLMNRAYNHSKHAGSKDHTVTMNPRTEACELIDRAIMNFDTLVKTGSYELSELALAQRFRIESLAGVQSE